MKRFLGILFAVALVFSLAGISLPSPVLAQGSSSEVVYVDIDNVAGPWDGTSWATAYQTIQEGLDDAYLAGKEVWVAAGTHKPTSTTDRTLSFQLKSGVALYGGFNGTETMREQRDWATNVAILSGDIGIPGDNSDNSYHVVVGADNAIIDGFTISGGNANGTGDDRCGGGMYNSNVSPTVTNCTFYGNSADSSGGGMYNWESSPTVANCAFSGNWAWFGGGMYNDESSPMVTNCTFSNNSAKRGGGMYNWGSSPTVANCTFLNNSSQGGGGLYNRSSSPVVTNCTFCGNWCTSTGSGGGMFSDSGSLPTVTNCIFSNNSAMYYGGGMCNGYCSPPVINCVFFNNSANIRGGGMQSEGSSSTVTNCTFFGNSAPCGGGMYYGDSSSPVVTNCILWGNGEEIFTDGSSVAAVSYCNVQGGYPGDHNISEDPMFVDPTGNDYHLKIGSPCIDKGTDVGAPTEDIEGNPRPIDGDIDGTVTTDMGAYEYFFTNGGGNDGNGDNGDDGNGGITVGGAVAQMDKFGLMMPWIIATALVLLTITSLALWMKKNKT